MRNSLPTQTQHTTRWEGGSLPPLRLRDEKPGVLDTAAPVSAPCVAPAPAATVAPKTIQHSSWLKRHSLALLFVIALSIPAYYLASRFVVTAVVIQGRSMMPTLKDGERYYLNRWRYMFTKPERGDIVVIRDPGHDDFAVKRVIAKPLDWVNLKNGVLFVNGRRLDEPYLDKGSRTDAPDLKEKWIQLGQNQYYVLGDNRANSEDSRYYGMVQFKNILGVIVK